MPTASAAASGCAVTHRAGASAGMVQLPFAGIIAMTSAVMTCGRDANNSAPLAYMSLAIAPATCTCRAESSVKVSTMWKVVSLDRTTIQVRVPSSAVAFGTAARRNAARASPPPREQSC